jgi:hypothetical protein
METHFGSGVISSRLDMGRCGRREGEEGANWGILWTLVGRQKTLTEVKTCRSLLFLVGCCVITQPAKDVNHVISLNNLIILIKKKRAQTRHVESE